MPCSKFAPSLGYFLEILDHIEFEEMPILCSLWNFVGSCGVQARIDGGPCKDCGDSESGRSEEC